MRPILLLVLIALLALAVWLALGRGPDALQPGLLPPAARAPHQPTHADALADIPAPPGDGVGRAGAPTDVASSRPVPGPTLVLARVTAVETGRPLEHVHVSAWDERGSVLASPQAVETDEEGYAELEVPHGVALVVSAQGDGRTTGSASARIETLGPGERRSVALAIVTQEDLVVNGIVRRHDTREPVAGVVVESEARSPSGPGPRAVTGNDGRFRIAVRSFATASIRYEHDDFGPALSPARAGHESPASALEILLEPAASIRAAVVAADGADTSGWTLVAAARAWDVEQPPLSWISGPQSIERGAAVAGGLAVLERLPARAPLDLALRRGSSEVWRAREPVLLAPGEVRAIECRVGGGSIHGFAREVDGSPAIGVAIRAVRARPVAGSAGSAFESAPGTSTDSASDGAYRFDGLDPGAWLVGPAFVPDRIGDPRRDPAPIPARVEIADVGGDVRQDIVIVRGLVIAGRVEDADGSAAPGAVVEAQAESTGAARGARCDAQGRFVLGPLVQDAWIVRARSSEGATSIPERLDAGREDVVVRLVSAATLRVEVVDETGTALAGALTTLLRADGTGEALTLRADAAGAALFDEAAFGPYHVATTTADGRFGSERDVEVAPGGTTRVVVVVHAAGRARLRFDGPEVAAFVIVVDRGLLVQAARLVRGRTLDLIGPPGEVEVQVHVGGRRHDRRVTLAREPGEDIVFDGGWR